MRLRICLAMIVCLGFTMGIVVPASAGVIAAVIDKHKSNPEGLHAKIKQKKALSDHKPLFKHGK